MSLTLLATTHRVAPGLLTWRAWRALHDSRVLTATPDHPQLPYLKDAGVVVEVVAPEPRPVVDAARVSEIVWLAAPDGDGPFFEALGELVVADPMDVEIMHASYDLPGARLLDLVNVMAKLRRECPWDQQQTHESLMPYLIEETYETADAIAEGDYTALREELGDVLLQVYFHSVVASEREDGFTIDDVAGGIVDKLVRRHPHVFSDTEVADADEVNDNWETIKKSEKGGRSSVAGVPVSQPARMFAAQLERRARKAGAPEELFAGYEEISEAAVSTETQLRSWALEFRARVEEWERQSRG